VGARSEPKDGLRPYFEPQISERHGRALLAVPADQQADFVKKIVNDKLTVKETEALITKQQKPKKHRRKVTKHGVSGDTAWPSTPFANRSRWSLMRGWR